MSGLQREGLWLRSEMLQQAGASRSSLVLAITPIRVARRLDHNASQRGHRQDSWSRIDRLINASTNANEPIVATTSASGNALWSSICPTAMPIAEATACCRKPSSDEAA